MTFLSDLARLREAHKKYGGWDTYGNLSACFMKHADAIEELVRAAEDVDVSSQGIRGQALFDALEKLNRSE